MLLKICDAWIDMQICSYCITMSNFLQYGMRETEKCFNLFFRIFNLYKKLRYPAMNRWPRLAEKCLPEPSSNACHAQLIFIKCMTIAEHYIRTLRKYM